MSAVTPNARVPDRRRGVLGAGEVGERDAGPAGLEPAGEGGTDPTSGPGDDDVAILQVHRRSIAQAHNIHAAVTRVTSASTPSRGYREPG